MGDVLIREPQPQPQLPDPPQLQRRLEGSEVVGMVDGHMPGVYCLRVEVEALSADCGGEVHLLFTTRLQPSGWGARLPGVLICSA